MAPEPARTSRLFSAALDATLPDLGRFPNVAEWGEAAPSEFEAVYFDTAGQRLTAAGIALEHRTLGAEPGWLLHLLASDGNTRTVRVDGGDAAGAPPPPALGNAVKLHARSARLTELAQTRTERRTFELRDDSGALLARVHDDRITVISHERDDSDSPVERRRMEFEPATEDDALLRAAIAALEVAGALSAGPGSHLRGGFDDSPEPHPHGKVKKGSNSAKLAGALLRQQVAELEHWDVLVRLDVPDSVHKLRVAMRRLRSTLASFRPLFDREQTDPVRDEVKWIAGMLGEARDAEVSRELLAHAVAEEPADFVADAVRERIDRGRVDDYRAAHDTAVAAMRSKRYLNLVDRLGELAADPPWTPLADKPARKALPALVEKAFKRTRKRVRAAADAAPEDRAARLHDVRKAAKRARYTAEALIPVHGDDAVRFAAAMEEVQSVLGDHHDAVALLPLLRRLNDEADGEGSFAYGRLHAGEESRAAELAAEFEEVWAAASRKKLRRWLG